MSNINEASSPDYSIHTLLSQPQQSQQSFRSQMHENNLGMKIKSTGHLQLNQKCLEQQNVNEGNKNLKALNINQNEIVREDSLRSLNEHNQKVMPEENQLKKLLEVMPQSQEPKYNVRESPLILYEFIASESNNQDILHPLQQYQFKKAQQIRLFDISSEINQTSKSTIALPKINSFQGNFVDFVSCYIKYKIKKRIQQLSGFMKISWTKKKKFIENRFGLQNCQNLQTRYQLVKSHSDKERKYSQNSQNSQNSQVSFPSENDESDDDSYIKKQVQQQEGYYQYFEQYSQICSSYNPQFANLLKLHQNKNSLKVDQQNNSGEDISNIQMPIKSELSKDYQSNLLQRINGPFLESTIKKDVDLVENSLIQFSVSFILSEVQSAQDNMQQFGKAEIAEDSRSPKVQKQIANEIVIENSLSKSSLPSLLKIQIFEEQKHQYIKEIILDTLSLHDVQTMNRPQGKQLMRMSEQIDLNFIESQRKYYQSKHQEMLDSFYSCCQQNYDDPSICDLSVRRLKEKLISHNLTVPNGISILKLDLNSNELNDERRRDCLKNHQNDQQ